MQCCTGNGTVGLYAAWEAIVRRSGDAAQVNLLLNRASEAVDIESWLPYEGRVVLRNRELRRIAVRIPSWVRRREVRPRTAQARLSPAWVGNFLVLDNLKPGEPVTIEFPVPLSAASYTTASGTPDEQTYRFTFRGGTVVEVSPRSSSSRFGRSRSGRPPYPFTAPIVIPRTKYFWMKG
jgi:hypothetical protein